MKLIVHDPPSSVPEVLFQVPVKVWTNPTAPRFRVPPVPLTTRFNPFTLPVKVAVPAVFVIETTPVVVNPSMLCAESDPAKVILELPACNPFVGSDWELTKLPLKVRS